MDDIINDLGDGRTRLIFELVHDDLVYRDALYYDTDSYKKMKAADIAADKQARFDAWVLAITPVEETPPATV